MSETCREAWIIKKFIEKSKLSNAEKIKLIAEHYGYDTQTRQCIEEMTELTQAINKFWRNQLKCGSIGLYESGSNNNEYSNFVEEIADVQIMLDQMIFLLVCEEDVDEYIKLKLDRQMDRTLESY